MTQSLGDVLVQHGVLTPERLEQAEHIRMANGTSLGRTLIELNMATEAQIVGAVATQIGLPFVDVKPGSVDPSAARLLPRDVARQLMALPGQFGQCDSVLVALADPANSAALSQVAAITGLEAHPALAVKDALAEAIEHLADADADGTVQLPVDGAGQPAGPGFDGAAAPAEPPAGLSMAAASTPTGPTAAPERRESAMQESKRLAYEQSLGFDLEAALIELVNRGGSDLHLTVGIPPAIRVHGELEHLPDVPVLEPDMLRNALYSIMTQKQREIFENELELDMSHSIPGYGRFRVNIFQQREAIGSVMRVIPFEIKPLEELGIPAQVSNFAFMPRGLVLVTGPTGSGKSTTLASLIDIVNRERAQHIMTVEDPIEFLHHHKKSVVNQRELGQDTHSFAQALKHVLRQDPDVILVGEMRDLETIQLAITAAETGHLVFGTLHTQDAPQTIDRIIDVFPPHQQEQIRVMLSNALNGVVTQQLLKRSNGSGRAVAVEVMVATPAIKNLIREGKTHQMYSSIQAGKQHGMIAMDQSLAELVNRGIVTYNHAIERCANVADFNRLCGRA
ncbi:PilT/PilU family type 4a pilus ATPase [Euzebya sp.]|uniref:PilT/PilU family type 4a pilus ATPase n=1 Tax=Euzebya sp. TaxID=1971409 RepID=UPI003518B02D